MTSSELENLVAIGQLKRQEPNHREIAMLLRSGRARLADAKNPTLAAESRFDLAYNAAHALALAALRARGYRSDHRFVVFQVLQQTAGVPHNVWRVMARAHGERNLMEYEGGSDVSERLIADLIAATDELERAITAHP